MTAAWRNSYAKLTAACLFLNAEELDTLLAFVLDKAERQAGPDRGAPEYRGQFDVDRLASFLGYTSGLLTSYRCRLDDESLAESISRLEKEMLELSRLIQPHSSSLDPLPPVTITGPESIQ